MSLSLISRVNSLKRIKDKRRAKAPQAASVEIVRTIPDWAQPLLTPARYKCLYGGRGSGKSYAVADALLEIGLTRKIRVLCVREFQNSIAESVHQLLSERIEALNLSSFYQAPKSAITGLNGSEFIFKGVRLNAQSIKSMQGITHLWAEEAQTISDTSWQIIKPTVREPNSEIWVTFNPVDERDVVWRELVAVPRKNAYVCRVNWDQNPFFPDVLNQERLDMLATDPDAYQHIWEGGFWQKSNAQIFSGKWVVDEFEPGKDWGEPLHGADFGFSQDPTTLIRCWVVGKKLYIERESWGVRVELDQIGDRWREDIPGCDRYPIRADSARPDTISYLKRHGFPLIVGVEKGQGSVESGIEFIRSFEQVVIHPRCKHVIEEARMYCYKVDPQTGEPLRIIIDAWNHGWDGVRYALAPLIKSRGSGKWGVSGSSWG